MNTSKPVPTPLCRLLVVAFWVLLGATGLAVPANAVAQSRVFATLDCVEPRVESNDVIIKAYLGYFSEFASPVTIPIGLNNYFSPGLSDRGQPTTFQPADHERAFSVEFNSTRISSLYWMLSADDLNGGLGGDSDAIAITNEPADYCAAAITAIAPDTVQARPGDKLTLTLTGENFAPDSEVWLVGPTTIAAQVQQFRFVELVASFTLPPNTLSGEYEVRVDGPTGNNDARFQFLTLNVVPAILALASTPAGILYAGTDGAGVFKSTDGGQTWAPANNGLGGLVIHSLQVMPNDAQTILAGTKSYGVYISTNGGRSWQPMNNGLPIPP